MNYLQLKHSSIFLSLGFMSLLFSCKDDDGGVNPDLPAPTIATVTPLAGVKFTPVTIQGTNFSTKPSDNIVTFNGVQATVTSATATQLQVLVPPRAGDGEITVTRSGKLATGPAFDYEVSYGVETFGPSQIAAPMTMVRDANGNFFIADYPNNVIRKLTPDGTFSVFAGSTAGFADGTGAAAKFMGPTAIAIDGSGNLYVAEYDGHRIRKISPSGAVTTLAGVAGSGDNHGFKDGAAAEAQFYRPSGVAVAANGDVYVADTYNERIRKISGGQVSTLAGNGIEGFANGVGTAAMFKHPNGLTFDRDGNLLVADTYNHSIRRIVTAGAEVGKVTTVAGTGTAGFADGAGSQAQFNEPWEMAVDQEGNIFVPDNLNHRIRKINAEGVVSTYAGSNVAGTQDGELATARFNNPVAIIIDADGILYIGDFTNKTSSVLRRIAFD